MSSLNPYLAELQARLGDLPPFVQQDVVEELRGHLEDCVSSLELQGISGEASMSGAIERFGKAGEVGTALRDVHRRVSWGKVGLAVLPGLFAIGINWTPSGNDLLATIGLAMCILLGVVGLLLEHRFAVWSFTAIGAIFGLTGVLAPVLGPLWLLATIAFLAVYHRRGIHVPALIWILLGLMVAVGAVETAVLTATDGVFFWSYLLVSLAPAGGILLPVVVGLLLARRSGVLAGLFVGAAGFVLVDRFIEPTYGLWKTPWGIIMNAIIAGLFLIGSPAWVLRSRSERGRVWGLLLPAFTALAGVVVVNAIVRTNPAILERIVNFRALFPGDPFVYGISGGSLGKDNLIYLLIRDGLIAAQLFMGMSLSVALYHWVESQGAGVGPYVEAIDQKLYDVLTVRGT